MPAPAVSGDTDDDEHPPREKDFGNVCGNPGLGGLVPAGAGSERDFFCNDLQPADRGRIDYIFVERPRAEHSFNLDLARVRRRTFGRSDVRVAAQPEENDREYYLSDHLGLDTVLIASARI